MPIEITDTISPYLDKMRAEMRKLNGCEIKIGILSEVGGEMLMIAKVHEFGATIRPRNAKNLAIPLRPDMRDVSPTELDDTWIYTSDEGNRFIVQDVGEDRIEFLFMLVPSVTIPERSFIRAGYDTNKAKITAAVKKVVREVLLGEKTAEQAAEYVGLAVTAMIKQYMRSVQPPKSKITMLANPGKNQPLMQTGSLRDSIAYEVVWK